MEDMLEIIKNRHSVRSYTDKAIEGDVKDNLNKIILECNQESNLDIKLYLDEPNAFNTFLAHYGKFNNVKNYIVLAGKKSDDLDEKCGYYGEKIVLKAQELGLNTCWVGLTYGKGKIPGNLNGDEKIVCTIAIGYGSTQGISHKVKDFKDVSLSTEGVPDWYRKGIEYALLAPTAMNQQKFSFELLSDGKVRLKNGNGFFTKVDLGIVKYHFELGAEEHKFDWSK